VGIPSAGTAGGQEPGDILVSHKGGKVSRRGPLVQPSSSSISLSNAAAPATLCHYHAGSPQWTFHDGKHHQGVPTPGAP
jgi:hypothetical protein